MLNVDGDLATAFEIERVYVFIYSKQSKGLMIV